MPVTEIYGCLGYVVHETIKKTTKFIASSSLQKTKMNVIGMNEVIHLLMSHTELYSTLLTHNIISNEVNENGKQKILSGDCTNEVVEEIQKNKTQIQNYHQQQQLQRTYISNSALQSLAD